MAFYSFVNCFIAQQWGDPYTYELNKIKIVELGSVEVDKNKALNRQLHMDRPYVNMFLNKIPAFSSLFSCSLKINK